MKNQRVSYFSRFLLGGYFVILLAPILTLFLYQGESSELDSGLFQTAIQNTFLLAIGVLSFSTVVGSFFAYCYHFYKYPFKKTLHLLMLMPLAFPAYVLAFLYLGSFGSSTHWSNYFEIQGHPLFLIFVLSLSLTPYIYYFSILGLKSISQSEWETHRLLKASWTQFFCCNIWPKWFPFLVSAQILVLFESLSDFGAASVVNVPVVTTMIYKLWFDLFSFGGAVQLSLRYSSIILIFLLIELLFKSFQNRSLSTRRDPLRGKPLPRVISWGLSLLALIYVGVAFLWPALQICLWALQGSQWSLWVDTMHGAWMTLALGLSVGLIVVTFSSILHLKLRELNQEGKMWSVISTIGYSVPGSILAVSIYAILVQTSSEISTHLLLGGLVVGLAYKFLTVGMRPIAESAYCLPGDLLETGRILKVSRLKKFRDFYFPYMKDSGFIALMLVMIEVMKEMPLTLMLSPSHLQTLSIKIFNFTSEGEWEKAALPSLVLLLVGVISVSLINFRRSQS